MTADKDLEKGNFALLIAAYLTLNTSLNLLNKVSLYPVANVILVDNRLLCIQSTILFSPIAYLQGFVRPFLCIILI
jgi:hypothetical protein